MTTAHRPTWNAAAGSSEQGGNRMLVPTRQYSSRDLPGQLKMKERPDKDNSKRDFKKELLERERKSKNPAHAKPTFGYDDEEGEQFEPPVKKSVKPNGNPEEEIKELENRPKYVNPFPQDADDDGSEASSDEKSDKKSEKSKHSEDEDAESEKKKANGLDDDSDDDDDSDNEKLFEEYERIKKQREEEQKRKQREKEEELQKEREQEILKGNPLMDGSTYSLEKRWFEDTVFKNQAKTEPKEKKRFINDTVRSDFHKKFLSKYIFT